MPKSIDFYKRIFLHVSPVRIIVPCSDHPSNTKRGGVCLYYKNYLPLKVLDISYLKECVNFELKISDKSCNLVAVYMFPSQSQDDFETFSDKFEMTLTLKLWRKKVLFERQLLVTLTLNPITGIIMIKRASKVVPLKV